MTDNQTTTEPGTEIIDPKAPRKPFKFAPPNYNDFSLNTGFQYGSLFDQMKDAFSMPGRGAGAFNNNALPRYGQPAPQMNFPGGFMGLLQQFMKPNKGMPGAPGNGSGGLGSMGGMGPGAPGAPTPGNMMRPPRGLL